MKKSYLSLVIPLIISLLLALNLVYKDKESECRIEVEKMQNNLTSLHYYNILQNQRFEGIETYLFVTFRNYTYNSKDNSITMFINPDFKDIYIESFNLVADTQKDIRSLENETLIKSQSCNSLSIISTSFLYIAIVSNLFAIAVTYIFSRTIERKKQNVEER